MLGSKIIQCFIAMQRLRLNSLESAGLFLMRKERQRSFLVADK